MNGRWVYRPNKGGRPKKTYRRGFKGTLPILMGWAQRVHIAAHMALCTRWHGARYAYQRASTDNAWSCDAGKRALSAK